VAGGRISTALRVHVGDLDRNHLHVLVLLPADWATARLELGLDDVSVLALLLGFRGQPTRAPQVVDGLDEPLPDT
jgi:hypothetical protein